MSLFTKKQPPAPDLRLEALEAEYKNYRRRTQDARETAYQDAQRKTVLAFLPLYDDLERALSAPCRCADGQSRQMLQPRLSRGGVSCDGRDGCRGAHCAGRADRFYDGRRGPAASKGRRRELTGSLPRRTEFFKYFEGAFHICPESSVLTSAPQIPALP